MSSTPYVLADRPRSALGRVARFQTVADYVQLTKPRIAVLVLIVVAASGMIASSGPVDAWLLGHTILGTALVAASASALNQWWERAADARMQRTADRPLPDGRLSPQEALSFGGVTITAGLLYLTVTVGLTAAGLGLLTWLLYVALYTPLKQRTWLNTVVGAVAGAMPVLIGAAAMGRLDVGALALFVIVYLWQFPHFMAIAWLYRRQYAAAGFQMLTVVDPSGRRAGRQALAVALMLVPVSLAPFALLPLEGMFAFPVAALGLGQAVTAAAFFRRLDDAAARRLLLASLIYLPTVFCLFLAAG